MLPRLSRLLAGATLTLSLTLAASLAQAARAYIVVDATNGTVLESQNPGERLYPASLTKMMTLYLTFEALKQGRLHWDDRLVMSENAESKDPYKFAVGAGRSISVREAVLGMIILSTNDSAVAVAETLSGSEAAFGKVMTAKAHELGMKDTTFTNPAGLPDPIQVTTATDMARLGMALMRDFPEEFKLFSEKRMVFRGMKLHGHNGVLMAHDWADGIKTGYTEASGYNLVTSATNGARRLVGVVLGSDTEAGRDAEMVSLMEKYLGPLPPPAVANSDAEMGDTGSN
ncbi:D-alanyl-D-alanine carboxypeptidase family protein [Rhizobium halophytocola]|uniref:D-alanyl-D-alanine carboxypeptidase (Penicillin-binding protein 5/6) n=1 Tax=Rhizobium halophytocola TaxID=735519 RepID=A0ABS4DZA9_9HYPH|nr:D-alanyl-D-alanine carboxypeptidase family protein [Rhizobium halophytocola]MBP1851023.1 D-alanyl-D-alanine carboxypeptidase (penicillin-binding protein 5/6) [Rhizobium halophytocola]